MTLHLLYSERCLAKKLPYLPQKQQQCHCHSRGQTNSRPCFRSCFPNWSRLCCQQENRILHKSRGTYLPLHFQRWDNSSMAAFNSCPVHIHSTSPCSLPRKDIKGEISQLQRWVVAAAIKDTAACSAKKCLGWALWMCRLSFSNARQLYQGISKLVCISVEQKEAILILNS